MPFLAQTCAAHGEIAQTGQCCDGLTAWPYDANSGQAYDGFACWNAPCAQAGQWAGPGGQNAGKCCTGLTVVNGKCAVPTSGGGGSTYTPPPADTGDWLSNFANNSNLIMYGGLALVALLLLSKKR